MTRFGISFAAAILFALPGLAADFGRGRLPIEFDAGAGIALDGRQEIVIEGVVESSAPVEIVMRTDDVQSTEYSSRAHDTRVLPPGPFRMVVSLDGMRTTNGRQIDRSNIKRLVLFLPDRKGEVSVTRFASAITSSSDGTTPVDQLRSAAVSLPVELATSGALRFGADDVLHIEGVLQGSAPAPVALRIDDGRSTDYDSRINVEQTLRPGPFRLSYKLSEQATRAGRKLDRVIQRTAVVSG